MGLFSFVGGLIGGGKAKKASRKADAAQIEALNKLIGVQQQQYDQTRADFAPYREGGGNAMVRLSDALGLNGEEAQAAAIQGLRDSPLFKSLYRTGEEATLANASATGGLRGGDTQAALYNVGEDSFTRTLQDQLSRLASTAGIGIGAVSNGAGFGADAANRIGQAYSDQGQVKAQGYLTRGGINASMWNNAGSFLDSIGKNAMPGGGGISGIIRGLFG